MNCEFLQCVAQSTQKLLERPQEQDGIAERFIRLVIEYMKSQEADTVSVPIKTPQSSVAYTDDTDITHVTAASGKGNRQTNSLSISGETQSIDWADEPAKVEVINQLNLPPVKLHPESLQSLADIVKPKGKETRRRKAEKDKDIISAIAEIRDNPILSKKKAAAMYNLPSAVLSRSPYKEQIEAIRKTNVSDRNLEGKPLERKAMEENFLDEKRRDD